MGVSIRGKGFGKTFFSQIILEIACDADLSTRNKLIEYSTDAREVVTIGDMIRHHKLRSKKGQVIDEYV